MRNCTGKRYAGEATNLAGIEGWHGKFGHINVLKLDHDSPITGRGKHDRIVAFCPEGKEGYARIDHVWELGNPTDLEIVKEFKRQNNIKGAWRVESREGYDKSTDVYLIKA